jgi:hypothetical protein
MSAKCPAHDLTIGSATQIPHALLNASPGHRQRGTAHNSLADAVISNVERAGKWPQWQQVEARLAGFTSLEDVREAWRKRDDRCYQVVAGLTALGSRRGGDDDDAALAVAVLLEDGVRRVAAALNDVCEPDDVTTTVWEEVKAAEPHAGCHAAAYLLRRARQRLSRPAAGMVSRIATTSLETRRDPGLDETLAAPSVEDPIEDLADLLIWARQVGVIAAEDVDLLVELLAAENSGLAREEAQRVVGERHGVALRTIRRRRDRTAARLRDAAPDYLAAIA